MPSPNQSFHKFSDFLQNREFVQWKMFPTDESDAYWNAFLAQHPHLEPTFREAEAHFARIGIERDQLSDAEKRQLWENILKQASSASQKVRTLRRGRWQIAAAACAAVALVVALNVYLGREKSAATQPEKELIAGNLLNDEDIQLITEGEAVSFSSDVEIQIDADGKTTVLQHNAQTEQTIAIAATHALSKLVVPYGKRTQLTLSDGSRAWLNSGSVLEFPSRFDGENRQIHLASGEMYIEVAADKNRPFLVRTADFDVRVYGTRFNVSAYADAPSSVVLVEGSVGLTAANHAEMALSPNEQAVLGANGTFSIQKVDVERFTSWRNGYFVFEETPISEILKYVERYYNLSFKHSSNAHLEEITCKGKLYLSEDMDNVLNSIALLSSTHYKRENGTFYFYK